MELREGRTCKLQCVVRWGKLWYRTCRWLLEAVQRCELACSGGQKLQAVGKSNEVFVWGADLGEITENDVTPRGWIPPHRNVLAVLYLKP
jgi:hypothetical protein